jgi:nicotinate-nucleotide--dimethylbenzimidazole phosphoribosyltransferase
MTRSAEAGRSPGSEAPPSDVGGAPGGTLEALLRRVEPPDARLAGVAWARLDRLSKPPGSLGRLEELAVRVVMITGRARPALSRPVIFTLAGDHGVAVEGVSAYPQAVTAQMVVNLCRGGAAVNALARQVGARVVVADLGVAGAVPAQAELSSCRVRAGTRNLAEEPAMTAEETRTAIETGARLVEEADPDVIGTGEMGIANTTAASALTAALTGVDPAAVTGRGTGIDEVALGRKVGVVRRALAAHRPDRTDPLGSLTALGGLEIAGLVGVILAGAARRVPVVLDGFIATAAALVAVRLAPAAREYLVASHLSAEPGHAILLEALGLEPCLRLGLRLGEGTGAALGIGLLRAALACYLEMATLEGAGVSGPVS